MTIAFFVILLISLCLSSASATVQNTVRHRALSFAERKALCATRPKLVCRIQATKGYKTRGMVHFTPEWLPNSRGGYACFVRVRAHVKGLFATKHGFHIHQYGDIRGEDGTSTGGHFGNPKGNPVKHGFPTNSHRHWGDLGNLHVRAGTSTYNRVDRVINVRGIVGRAITIHAEGDKGPMSQPSGGAGARIGYCVIGYANPGL